MLLSVSSTIIRIASVVLAIYLIQILVGITIASSKPSPETAVSLPLRIVMICSSLKRFRIMSNPPFSFTLWQNSPSIRIELGEDVSVGVILLAGLHLRQVIELKSFFEA